MVEEDRLRGRDLNRPGFSSVVDPCGATVRKDDSTPAQLYRVRVDLDAARVARPHRIRIDGSALDHERTDAENLDRAGVAGGGGSGIARAPCPDQQRTGVQALDSLAFPPSVGSAT